MKSLRQLLKSGLADGAFRETQLEQMSSSTESRRNPLGKSAIWPVIPVLFALLSVGGCEVKKFGASDHTYLNLRSLSLLSGEVPKGERDALCSVQNISEYRELCEKRLSPKAREMTAIYDGYGTPFQLRRWEEDGVVVLEIFAPAPKDDVQYVARLVIPAEADQDAKWMFMKDGKLWHEYVLLQADANSSVASEESPLPP